MALRTQFQTAVFPSIQKQRNSQRIRFNAVSKQQCLVQLAQKYPVIHRMLELIAIPSATPQTDPRFTDVIQQNLDRIRQVIVKRFQEVGVTQIEHNRSGALVIRVPGTGGYEKARPLMLTAHMDIVAGDPANPSKPVRPSLKIINGTEFIVTDGTTTLGADDKGGLAMILEVVSRLRNKPHVPLEILLSPDEESSCDSLRNLDTRRFKAKHVLVVDEFYEYQLTTGLASAVNVKVSVEGTQGGHSGDDINRPNRLNAIELLNRITQKMGTGVISYHPQYPKIPFISKNLGLIQGGSAPNAIPESAQAIYMLRSFEKKAQNAELNRMESILRSYRKQYKRTQPNLKLKLRWDEEYPAWLADPKSPLPKICTQAAQALGQKKVNVLPSHAAAQASILATKKNAYGEAFDAALIGPNIQEAHTVRERLDWKSLVRSTDWLEQIIETYSLKSKSLL